jgi:hypothetical protein
MEGGAAGGLGDCGVRVGFWENDLTHQVMTD